MNEKSRISLLVLTLVIAGSTVVAADPLEKLPREVRLQFLESLRIMNGRPASAKIDSVKKHLSKAEWQQLKSMFGWGHLGADHENMCCNPEGTCSPCQGYICDERCHGGAAECFSVSGVLQTIPLADRNEFLLAMRFDRGRATNLPLGKIRRYLKPSEIGQLEKMAR